MYMEQSFSNPNSRTQLSAERGVSRQIPGAQKALDVILTPRQKCWKDVVIYGLFHSFHFDHITRVRGNFTERKICPWPGKVENCRHSKLIEYYEHFQMLWIVLNHTSSATLKLIILEASFQFEIQLCTKHFNFQRSSRRACRVTTSMTLRCELAFSEKRQPEKILSGFETYSNFGANIRHWLPLSTQPLPKWIKRTGNDAVLFSAICLFSQLVQRKPLLHNVRRWSAAGLLTHIYHKHGINLELLPTFFAHTR